MKCTKGLKMKIVPQKAELIAIQHPLRDVNPLKIVESCGRVCYRSEDKITDDSYKDFCAKLYKMGHWAVFEHGVYTFSINKHSFLNLCECKGFADLYGVQYTPVNDGNYCEVSLNLSHLYQLVKCCKSLDKDSYEYHCLHVLVGSFPKEVLDLAGEKPSSYVYPLTSNIGVNSIFYTFKLTTFRSVADELFRHRRNALNMESSRYCSYNKDKFDSSIKTCEQHWVLNKEVYKDKTESLNMKLVKYLREAEKNYLDLVNSGMRPQDARAVLPLDYCVDCCITMSMKQFEYIYKLRTSDAAHPNIRHLLKLMKEKLDEGCTTCL